MKVTKVVGTSTPDEEAAAHELIRQLSTQPGVWADVVARLPKGRVEIHVIPEHVDLEEAVKTPAVLIVEGGEFEFVQMNPSGSTNQTKH